MSPGKAAPAERIACGIDAQTVCCRFAGQADSRQGLLQEKARWQKTLIWLVKTWSMLFSVRDVCFD